MINCGDHFADLSAFEQPFGDVSDGLSIAPGLFRRYPVPISTVSQYWVRRRGNVVVDFAAPTTRGRSPNARLVVTMTEGRSTSLLIGWSGNRPPVWANGR